MTPMKSAALLVLAVLLAGCGLHASAADRRGQVTLQQAQACVKVTRPVVRQLTALSSRMSVGMMFDDYNAAVGSVRVAYDRMIRASKDVGGLNRTCVKSVGAPLQGSLNAYIRADNAWTRCNEQVGCTIQRGVARVQTRRAWLEGARLASKADTALTWLQPK